MDRFRGDPDDTEGLFDADGSISILKNEHSRTFHATICHASRDLLSDVARILKIKVIPGHGTHQISINGRGRIQELGLYFYEGATRYLKYKADRFRESYKVYTGERVRTFNPIFNAANDGTETKEYIIRRT